MGNTLKFDGNPIKITFEARDYSWKFIDCAKDDIKAVELLYKNQIFSLSVYHMQQAIEKILKSYLIISGAYEIKEPESFRHNLDKMINDMMDRTDSLNYNFNKAGKTQHPFPKEQLELKTLTIDKLFLLSGKQIKKFLEIGEKRMSLAHHAVKQLNEQPDSLAGKLLFSINYYLIPCAIIFGKHENCSRYPGLVIDPTNYSKNVGLVVMIPEIILGLKEIIMEIEQWTDRTITTN